VGQPFFCLGPGLRDLFKMGGGGGIGPSRLGNWEGVH